MNLSFQILLENIPLILCILAGIGLLVVEVFVPGFGLPGLSGLALIVISVWMIWKEFGAHAGVAATLFAAVLAIISIICSLRSAASGKLARSPLFLKETSVSGEAAGTDEKTDLTGEEGVTDTVLNPVGFAVIGGRRVNVITEGVYLDKGERVSVIAAEGNRVVVRKKEG